MVTFLVCLVVVGGAVVAILWLTTDEGRQPATDADGASRGTRVDRLAGSLRRTSAFLVPGGSRPGGARGGDRTGTARRRPAVPAGAGMTVGSVALAQAAQARAEAETASSTDTASAGDAEVAPASGLALEESDTVSMAVTEHESSAGPDASNSGSDRAPMAAADTDAWDSAAVPGGPDTAAVAVTEPESTDPAASPGQSDTGTLAFFAAESSAGSAVLVETDTGPVPTGGDPAHTAVDLAGTAPWPDIEPDGRPDLSTGDMGPTPAPPAAEPTGPAAAPRGDRPSGRRERPSLGRRLLRRLRGATGLVVLLVALGALLALTLAAVTAMIVIGVRAAVGT